MTDIYIICVEDEPQVLDVILRDLADLEEVFPIETAVTADEARELIKEINRQGGKIGLAICDHVMPGDSGVDLMIEMQQDPFTRATRKVLLTGQAGLDATIEAVNKAKLDRYISKPWDPANLMNIAKDELTQYVIEQEKELLPYLQVLEAGRLHEEIRRRGYL